MVQNRVTFADAAYVILAEAREPLHYKELARVVLERGLFKSRGKTPEQTLRSQISREVSTKGDESRFINQDQGMIILAPAVMANIDQELVAFVLETSGMDAEEAKARAAEVASGAAAPAAPDAAAPEVEPEPEAAPAAEAAAPAVHDDLTPEDLDDDEDDDEDMDFSGTFASEEKDPVVHDAPPEMGEDDLDDSRADFVLAPPPIEDDTEQDFLSVAAEVGDEMHSREYEASMDELAPIVVPPHEGGAAEIARLPQGGRSVLIVKIVRRQGAAQIQLVEELESLVSGVVSRLLLTLPGEDLEEFLDALTLTKKVMEQSFRGGEEEGAPTGASSEAPREAPLS